VTWQVQEAKQRFSEVVRRALSQGPQTVSKHGKDVVVVISVEEYERLGGKQAEGFLDFLASFPGVDLPIEYDGHDKTLAPIVDFS